MVKLYGIANCDTVKKARRWLEQAGIEYAFHDYKKTPPTAILLQAWCKAFGYETLVNQRGTTWKKLPDTDKLGLDEERAIALMCQHPSLIKRPVLETPDTRIVGFDPVQYEALK
jgi:arsenate reductase (glutaredoxin)